MICSYEWTSTPNNLNMHRNIFFKDCAKMPARPFSALDSQTPSDLWAWMDKQRADGNDLLAISHNANVSGGLMYPTAVDMTGRPIDQAWAEARLRNERMVEVKQIKGPSETHPLLSPNDEFANFEILNFLLGNPDSAFITLGGSFLRQALKDGVAMQQARGFNPYKTGVAGGSDSHNTGVPYRQESFFGGHARLDGTTKERMAGRNFTGLDVRFENPAGLTGLWAAETTRAALFEAMQRRESFATSGPRMQIRFFAGWNYSPALLTHDDWVAAAYAEGVPMGADMPPPPSTARGGETRPGFVVWAVKDPTAANLDRIQIVKGWSKNGQSFEKVYDVVWAGARDIDPNTGKLAPIGSTVDIVKASYDDSIGRTELIGVWHDPDFDPTLDAFYCARALAIPTPRWTTIQARDMGIPVPQMVAAEIQERAWSSPIWYTPGSAERARAEPGQTTADLEKAGASKLDDAALKSLVSDKYLWLRNTVTGAAFKTRWSDDGLFLIMNADPRDPQPSEFGDLARHSNLGEANSTWSIHNGALVTNFGNRDYSYELCGLPAGPGQDRKRRRADRRRAGADRGAGPGLPDLPGRGGTDPWPAARLRGRGGAGPADPRGRERLAGHRPVLTAPPPPEGRALLLLRETLGGNWRALGPVDPAHAGWLARLAASRAPGLLGAKAPPTPPGAPAWRWWRRCWTAAIPRSRQSPMAKWRARPIARSAISARGSMAPICWPGSRPKPTRRGGPATSCCWARPAGRARRNGSIAGCRRCSGRVLRQPGTARIWPRCWPRRWNFTVPVSPPASAARSCLRPHPTRPGSTPRCWRCRCRAGPIAGCRAARWSRSIANSCAGARPWPVSCWPI